MSYLVLHVDVEFIVGTVYTDNRLSYPITHGTEELLWLYFHNNPHQNTISFGRDNKPHFNNSEVNYYGRFFENIVKDTETFSLRGIEHPLIDLLKEAGLVEIIRNTYQQITHDYTDSIPTLITFSSSVSDIAKQKTVDYLKKQIFQIDSYTIPIAELTCYHALNQRGLQVANGSVAIFIEASNSTLHLIKLTLSNNYFLKDPKAAIAYRGIGLDPRRRALVRFIVNEVNKATGVLSSDDEKEDEIDRLEHKADDWLKRLDIQTRTMPLRIPSVSFAKAPNMKRDVLVRKNDLDSDTGQYTRDLIDIFEAFRSDNVQGDVAVVFLLGNCFQSDRVMNSFKQAIGSDRLHFYTNRDIHDVLSMYPQIDINRYSGEEARIKAQAEAEKLKQAQQLAREDEQRKKDEEEEKKIAEAQKAEQNRKEALRLYERAVELEKAGKLEDAKINFENAWLKDKTNRDYKHYFDDLVEKINKLKDKNELYKTYLNKGDKFLEKNELDKALEEFEAAQSVFDNAEIIQKIIEVKRRIKNSKQKTAKIAQLFAEIQSLMSLNDLLPAQEKITEILSIDKENAKAKSLLKTIEQLLQQQEKERQEKENKEKCEQIVAVAETLFAEEKWAEAKKQYEMALNLCPQEKNINDKIKQCADNLKAQEDAFNELVFDANIAEKEGRLKDALSNLEEALQRKPDDLSLLSHIKRVKIKIKLDFDETPNNKTPVVQKPTPKVPKEPDEDFFNIKPKQNNTPKEEFIIPTAKNIDNGIFIEKKPKKTPKESDENFWNIKSQPKKIKDDDFIKKPQKKMDDDFW